MKMTRHRNLVGVVAEPLASERLPRCLCCEGLIAAISDQDTAVGLDLKLGLVSDECALICNGCTARLIEARASQREAPRKSR
jgi:hypothetical protein